MWTARIAAAALAALLSPVAAGDIPEAMKPVAAAARIFALENNLQDQIGVHDEDEGHIGEKFEVNHAPGEKCTFTLRHRDGPIVETISFDRLSDERRVSRGAKYAALTVPGRAGAVCEIRGSTKRCSDQLAMTLFVDAQPPTELDLAVRALRYLAGICPAAALPF
ncbi:hypothetical protein HU675_0038435 [Bradyrhizobium septentrionale]|uniref:hypothetical protein n=1 Tax=Bradyrhizobium septentrionale TaxID=1404411 RepID=UPI0015964EC8|nr:hypothetical protein [Bradyrhizobium septentrionale]UGY23766.1 hypothetical protein HU675_0038435 [Bradyrhizobium septentrionale]